jgi:hypothetical protein
MKKKVITALTVVFALCLAFTVYALNQNTVSPKTATDCCAKKDSCPMKDKQANAEKASCCDKDDCCKGDSCPMKTNGEKTTGKDCCCKDGDSCPMKKDAEKQTASIDMTNVTVASSTDDCCQPGADCCKSGSCCKGKHS